MKAEYTINIGGEEVEVLFSPRLYSFGAYAGIDFVVDKSSIHSVVATYTDIIFCAALNAWTLNGKDLEEFPFKRKDFHVWSQEEPKNFNKAFNKAVEALSGKSLKELLSEAKAGAKTQENPVKKKSMWDWITTRLRRS